MKRILSIILATVLILTTLIVPMAQADDGLTGTLRFAIYTDTARDAVANAQAELYMKEHPGVTIEVVSVPFANYYTQLGQGIAAGDAWDVFMVNGANSGALAKNGGLMDLTDEMTSRNFDISKYIEDPMNSTYEDRWYVLPYELNTSGILYNKDLFDAAGVAYPTEDWTWEDFRRIANELTIPDQAQFGAYLRLAQPDMISFIYEAGGQLYSDDLKTIDFTTPEVVEAQTFMNDMIVKDHCCPTPAEIPANISPFMTGKIAMASAMCFECLNFLSADFNWGVAPWPTYKNKGGVYWTQGMSMYSGTKNKELALDFIFWLAGEEGQTVMADVMGGAPSLVSVANTAYVNNEKAPDGMIYMIKEFANGNAVAEPFTEKWTAISGGGTSVVQSELTLVRLGEETLEEGLSNITRDAQALLDEIE